eukprot:CAMPEP_0202910296 /NCGR_PEP_ID=MMETSP1392-20130828/51663_1 /ASSEMBLY_ACC=CAM_ASM_000868 /TAXON_ID=225041 /ORGANISM="Chlamydomonas chlamydogama, Strain SAG 11-48b" /LENGTH=92 /DNA_ID=CAMNT_0049600365 /DNA_START=641 /DNA_END=919 /DNA_ORIENTATION=-
MAESWGAGMLHSCSCTSLLYCSCLHSWTRGPQGDRAARQAGCTCLNACSEVSHGSCKAADLHAVCGRPSQSTVTPSPPSAGMRLGAGALSND